MVRADDQQHLVARITQPAHRLDHARRIGVRLAQHGQMLGRAQRPQMLRGIRLAHPDDRQRGLRSTSTSAMKRSVMRRSPAASWAMSSALHALDALAAR
jgi:hypothetical protein